MDKDTKEKLMELLDDSVDGLRVRDLIFLMDVSKKAFRNEPITRKQENYIIVLWSRAFEASCDEVCPPWEED